LNGAVLSVGAWVECDVQQERTTKINSIRHVAILTRQLGSFDTFLKPGWGE
jgi:hypothetical protein